MAFTLRSLTVFSLTMIAVMITALSSAEAGFFRAELPTPNAQPALGTHVIVIGKGLEVGDQWLRAGHTQALAFRDRATHGPIVMISAIENANYKEIIKTWGYKNVQATSRAFTASELIAQLGSVQKIASIDFIGHNGAFLGFVLEDYSNRFFLSHARQLAAIKDRFTSDAFVRIMGCNTGWKLAPLMSEILGVPVAGTFTFADIQQIHQTGEWFYHDTGRFPEPAIWLKTNELSFFQPVTCAYQGGCMRLKPVRINYQGKHGTYAGTIPFLKYFCGPLNKTECFRRMAKSTQYLVSTIPLDEKPSKERYAQVVADQVCPAVIDANVRAECARQVKGYILDQVQLPRTFKTNSGDQLSCGFRKCEFAETCTDKCVFKATNKSLATTLVDELDAYKAGYEAWIR